MPSQQVLTGIADGQNRLYGNLIERSPAFSVPVIFWVFMGHFLGILVSAAQAKGAIEALRRYLNSA